MVRKGTSNWGLSGRIISHFGLALPQNSATLVFDKSNSDRTPNEHLKTVTITNLSGSDSEVFIGKSTVSASSFWFTLQPGQDKSIDCSDVLLSDLYAFTTGVSTSISVAQV